MILCCCEFSSKALPTDLKSSRYSAVLCGEHGVIYGCSGKSCFAIQDLFFFFFLWSRKRNVLLVKKIAKNKKSLLREEETSLVSVEKSIGFTHRTKMLYKIERWKRKMRKLLEENVGRYGRRKKWNSYTTLVFNNIFINVDTRKTKTGPGQEIPCVSNLKAMFFRLSTRK